MKDLIEKKPWYAYKRWIILLLLFLPPVGLYFLWKNKSLSVQRKFAFSLLVLVFILFRSIALINSSPDRAGYSNQYGHHKAISINDTIHSSCFDIKVESAGLEPTNMSAKPKADDDYYLTIKAKFINTSADSQTVTEGDVWIYPDSTSKTNDIITAKTCGLVPQKIASKAKWSGELVFKVPMNMRGTACWHPDMMRTDEMIVLGHF